MAALGATLGVSETNLIELDPVPRRWAGPGPKQSAGSASEPGRSQQPHRQRLLRWRWRWAQGGVGCCRRGNRSHAPLLFKLPLPCPALHRHGPPPSTPQLDKAPKPQRLRRGWRQGRCCHHHLVRRDIGFRLSPFLCSVIHRWSRRASPKQSVCRHASCAPDLPHHLRAPPPPPPPPIRVRCHLGRLIPSLYTPHRFDRERARFPFASHPPHNVRLESTVC